MATAGDRLRGAREGLGLTQIELANSLRTSPGQIWRWETQGVIPGGPWLVKLAKALGISTDWILTGEGHESSSREA